jgi:hypothetical protein
MQSLAETLGEGFQIYIVMKQTILSRDANRYMNHQGQRQKDEHKCCTVYFTLN